MLRAHNFQKGLVGFREPGYEVGPTNVILVNPIQSPPDKMM